MPLTPPDYDEFVDDRPGPSTAAFSLRQQSARATYDITPSENDDNIADALLDILGDVYPNGIGGLTRTLPAAHPRFPWLFAESIPGMAGLGEFELRPSGASYVEQGVPPIVPDYALQDRYRLHVNFTRPQYQVIPDIQLYPTLGSQLPMPTTLTWYDPAGVTRSDIVSREYSRFCWIDYLPKVQLITAQHGQMMFRLPAPIGGGPPTPPDTIPFPGKPQMRFPGGQIRLHWAAVPYSWVTHRNSWITKLQGYVNQTRFPEPLIDGAGPDGWQPGELLYENAEITPYTPPVPYLDQSLGDGIFSAERLCDITFVFTEAIRYQEAGKLPTPANGNWIAAGHNLMPWIYDRKWYYATSSGALPGSPSTDDALYPARWTPTFLSAPMQLLFSDPALVTTPYNF